MIRKLALAVSYVLAFAYILSILLPAFYCYSHGCKGPGELDAFMPAFAFTPLGVIATVFSLQDAVRHIRQRQAPSLFWPLAIIFSIVLLGVLVLVAIIIVLTALHR
ncbi:MAG TPA: hypothetical protein VMH20_15885 [Verrucomicrobiae bacterium]|nr:hypothetical protein [Verrucomicrobiae bacterium]